MRISVQRWGNSLAVRIPKTIARESGIDSGSAVDLQLVKGNIVLRPEPKPRYSLDELLAAALILYPTYVDPVTRLPCTPEILVQRIARQEDAIDAPLANLRVLQGKLKLALRRLREAAA